jgi:hypothetical protein
MGELHFLEPIAGWQLPDPEHVHRFDERETICHLVFHPSHREPLNLVWPCIIALVGLLAEAFRDAIWNLRAKSAEALHYPT